MQNFLEILEETDSLLKKAQTNLENVKKIQAPEKLESFTTKYSEVKISLRKLKEKILSLLIQMSLACNINDFPIWGNKCKMSPSGIRFVYDCDTRVVWSGSAGDFTEHYKPESFYQFCNALIGRVEVRLKEVPEEQANEILELRGLIDQLTKSVKN